MVKGNKMLQTEIGLFPEEWEVVSVRDVALINGRIGFRGYTIKDIVKEGAGAISLSPSNINDGKIIYNNCTYISWFKYDESPEIKIFERDVILVKTGSTFGKSAIVKKLNEKATLNPQLIVFKKIKMVNELFSYLVYASSFQNQIASSVVGGAIPTLSQEQVYSFKIPLPPLPEQEAIASALSDADAWIESLEQLIAKKRLIKQGVMQELLTPKEDWEIKKLGDFCDIDSENLSSNTNSDYEFKYISLENVDEGKLLGYTEHKYSTSPSRARRVLRKGDILISTVRPNLLSHFLFISESTVFVCSTGFSVIRTNQCSAFIYYHFFGSFVNNQINNLIIGSNYPAINSGDVKGIEIPLPSLSEQTRIATILSDMDAELEALATQLAKAKKIKQGMMQELLTGRIRLV